MGRKTGERGTVSRIGRGQNIGSEAPPRSKIGRERKEQTRCQGRSDCQRSDEEKQVCQSHSGGGGQRR